MNHAEFAQQILAQVAKSPSSLPRIEVSDSRRRNAGRCMAALARNRLSQNDDASTNDGDARKRAQHTFFKWRGGVVALRNSRIADGFWTNLVPSVEEEVHSLAGQQPAAYLLLHWVIEEAVLHAWAIPEDVARAAFASLKEDAQTGRKTVFISVADLQLKDAPGAPSFAPYYARAELTDAEQAKLGEAIKTDDYIRQERTSEADEDAETASSTAKTETDDDAEAEEGSIYSQQTVEFLLELPDHVDDGEWHEQNKRRYQRVLRNPSEAVVEQIAARYIQRLNPAVAAGKRHLSILKKNDYGQGGYHDHYWFAFYDPAAGSKTKSVQLFVRFLGGERVWRYGLSMGNYCGEYMSRLLKTITENRLAVVNYLHSAPGNSVVRLFFGESQHELTPAEFADRVGADLDGTFGFDGKPTSILVIREYPLDDLPDHAESFVDEVGTYFTWAWPLFDAAMTTKWLSPEPAPGIVTSGEVSADDVDETAPQTIQELSALTALPEVFLGELEDALLAKQQIVLFCPSRIWTTAGVGLF